MVIIKKEVYAQAPDVGGKGWRFAHAKLKETPQTPENDATNVVVKTP